MVGKPSKIRKGNGLSKGPTDEDGKGLTDEVRGSISRWSLSWLIVLIAFPLTALGIYCVNLPTGRWMAYGGSVIVSAASCLVGSLLGFLFGIPRALSSDPGISPVPSSDAKMGFDGQRNRLITNTNLEQVSDWLTKIIVGATLVQLGPLTHRFGELAKSVSSIFGTPTTQNTTMAGAIILYAAAFGFFATYIAARSIITFIFTLTPGEWMGEQQHTRAMQSRSGTEESQVERPISTTNKKSRYWTLKFHRRRSAG